jgi:5,5'-dehydrodivanillate O-demethylase oxygenase subunit
MEIRVPLDDTHMHIYEIRFLPTPNGELVPEDEPVEYIEQQPHKDPMGQMHPFTRHRMNQVDSQDYMAWETQGAIPDRSVERLATSDRGVVLLRNLFKEQIELVQQGLDPMGVQRDPNHPTIDTNLTHSLIVEAGLLPASAEGRR